MKYLCFLSCCILLLTGCVYNKATKFAENTKLPPGYYFYTNGFDLVFLKISNDSAYADFVHVEKFPRDLRSDTLLFHPVTQTWKSKKSEILQKGKYFHITNTYICYTCSDQKEYKAEYRFSIDEKGYKNNINTYKNYASVYMYDYLFRRKQPGPEQETRYDQIKQKYSFFENLDYMKHEDFLIEFNKFKAEVEKSWD